MIRPLSQTLTELIAVAADVITRRGMTLSGAGLGDQFVQLSQEVRQAEARPAESLRTTRAAMIMVFALEEFGAGPRDPGSPWLMLAGTTLPLLRVDAWLAMNNEREARADG